MDVITQIPHVMRVLPRRIPILLLALGLVLGTASTSAARQVQLPASAASGDFAGRVDIGGRSLYLECRGSGSPTVVLVHGYRASGRFWTDDLLQPDAPRTMVLPGVARFTRVCTYDRPGAFTTAPIVDDDLGDPSLSEAEATAGVKILPSRSDPVPQPRTVTDAVTELHTLLGAAGVPGPYVIAGHSLGGLLARLYAATYPDEVIGLVLVDPYAEHEESQLGPTLWPSVLNLVDDLGSNTVYPIPGYGDIETIDIRNFNPVMRQAVAASPLRPMPLAVLSHGQPFPFTEEQLGFPPAKFDQAWQAMHRELVALVPDGRLIVASKSGHDIHQNQPAVVTESIREVVEGVRDPDTWDDLRSCCAAA